MSSTNKQVVNDSIQVIWREWNLNAIEEFWNEDFVNHAAPPENRQGFENLRLWHEQLFQGFTAFSDLEIEVREQIGEGDKVATRIVSRGKHTGEFMGFTATDKIVELVNIRIDRIENEKIIEHWATFDLAGLMEQLNANNS
jgi:predicted ester cyclase